MLRSASQLEVEERGFLRYAPDKVAIKGFITNAQSKAQDALVSQVSIGTRFEANYDAAFSVALAVLNATGWRPRSVAGHHAFSLEAACAAIGASQAMFDNLDAVRELRNEKCQGTSRTERDLADARKIFEDFSALARILHEAPRFEG